jgi:uncharacterized protein YndB with AHSA1/START domain
MTIRAINGGLLVALAMFICMHQPSWAAAAATQSSGMNTVVNEIAINGPSSAVFDLITTARFWPQWHPATRAVAGVIERPYGTGDLIHERGRVGDADFETTWKVVEHERTSRIVLESQTAPARITYTFAAGPGTTFFTRRLEYKIDNFPASMDVEKTMRDQSARALSQLKALVEKILSEEAQPLR